MAANTGSGLIAAVRAQIEGLPRRSRIMLGFLLVLLGAVWMGGLWWWTSGSLAMEADSLATEQRMLRNVQMLQLKYRDAEQLINAAEERLGQANQNPSTYIEQKAKEIGVRETVREIKKMNTETRGNLRETRYRVTLQRAPIDGTMKLVHDIETSGFMAAETVEYKSAFLSGERTLNATIDLVSYELVKE